MEELTCKTGLKKDIIDCEVFEREISLCKKLSEGKDGCGWGKCADCGVVPLLVKLHQGFLLEEPEEIVRARQELIGLVNKK